MDPFAVMQPFGVNGTYYQNAGINIIGHNGLDLRAYHGQPIYAAHDGQALHEVDDKGGWGVVIISNQSYDYGGDQRSFKTIYWHMCDSTKEPQFRSPLEGEENRWKHVKAGELIGYADSTGFSTGDHLHFGLKPVTPGEPPSAVTTSYPNNGYLGSIDPAPFLGMGFVFRRDLEVGNENDDVLQLQLKLQELGYFPMTQPCTRYYGSITRSAVFAFQKDHIPSLSLVAKLVYRGRYCSAQTRAALNSL